MRTTLQKRAFLALLSLAILLVACQPTAPATQAAPAEPTSPTAPTGIPVQDTDQAGEFLDQHGFIAIATQDERYPLMVMSEDRQTLAPILEEGRDLAPEAVQGGIWMNEEQESVAVFTGQDDLPDRMLAGEYVVLFANYTETTVDVALYQGDELVSLVKATPLDADILRQYRALASENAALSGHIAGLGFVPPAKSQAARMLEMVGLMITLTACTASLAFPITAWASITVCSSTFLSAVTIFTDDDLQIFGAEVPIWVIDTVGCFGAYDGLSCVSLLIDATVGIIDKYDQVMADHDDLYAHAFDEPPPGGECTGGNCKTLLLENYSGTTDTITLKGPAEYTFPFGFGVSSHSLIYGTYQFVYTSCDGKWTSEGTLSADGFWSIAGPPNCND